MSIPVPLCSLHSNVLHPSPNLLLKSSLDCPHPHKTLLIPVLSQNWAFSSITASTGFNHRAPILNILFHCQTICITFFFFKNLEKHSHQKASIQYCYTNHFDGREHIPHSSSYSHPLSQCLHRAENNI